MGNFFHSESNISNLAVIDISQRGTNTIIGANSVIDDFVKIKHVGGQGDIILGEKVYINSGTVLYSGNGIKIGNNVLIGPNCSITPVNHEYEDTKIPIIEQGFKKSRGGIIIEDDVWIGANVVILDGSIIKKGAIVGASSLVNGTIDEFSIYFGTPAKKIKQR